MLTVDSVGDIVLVAGFGAACGSPYPCNLPTGNDWHVGLNHQSIYFEGQKEGIKDNIAIGFNCGDAIGAKLNVIQRKSWSWYNPSQNVSWGGAFFSFPDTLSDLSVAISGWADTNSQIRIGVWGRAEGNYSTGNNWAVGIYGEVTPHLPLTPPPPFWANPSFHNWAGVFNGQVQISSIYVVSDSGLKEDIIPISNSLVIIDSLKPRSFYFDTTYTTNKGLNLPSDRQIGFLAQDVEQILPELVTEGIKPPQYDEKGNEIYPAFTFKALNYNGFIGILTQGIKDLDSISNAQSVRIDSLENKDTGDYDFLLSGSNAQPKTAGDIDEIKYTN